MEKLITQSERGKIGVGASVAKLITQSKRERGAYVAKLHSERGSGEVDNNTVSEGRNICVVMLIT